MNSIHRFFIKLAYNGANFHGWQFQENSISVQQLLNEALSLFLNEKINTTGAGRTDTGVHAKLFYAHFDSQNLSNNNFEQLKFKLNCYLPYEIVIYEIFQVRNDAHARFDAISRTYQYFVITNKDPFRKNFTFRIFDEINIELMNKAALLLFEHVDFSSFSKSKTQVKTYHCNITQAKWENQDGLMVFTITADRFLRNMVRAIVGTLLEVGKQKISIEDFNNIIGSKNRSNAGFSVPAHALFLTDIKYPPAILQL